MTVSTTTSRASYPGNGTNDTFAYSFKIFADGDLTVIIRSADGTETTKTLTTHYTVTGAGTDSGGNVVFTTGNIPTATETVVILRELNLTQGTDYVANDPFPAESHEDALDRLTFIAQQIQEEADRSIKLSRTNTMTSTEFTVGATVRANKILAFDANGELAVTQEIGVSKGTWAAGVAYTARDIVTDGTNYNLYIANTAHTSSGSAPISSNTDVAKWDLLIDTSAALGGASTAEIESIATSLAIALG